MLIFLIFFAQAEAAYPACAANVTCPSGGIWSEWTSSGANCSTSCGSCSSIFYTRTCLSTSASCSCSGDTSRYIPCNTQSCEYPAQRTCCIPYLPMLINGTFQCGPAPKFPENTTSCCPVNGLWSSWSGYGRNDNDTLWLRSRKCVSEEAGCACFGNSAETKEDCPCRAMVDITKVAIGTGSYGVYPTQYTINETSCEYYGTLVLSTNPVKGNYPCNYGCFGDLCYNYTSIIRYEVPNNPGVASELRVSDCSSSDGNLVSFMCDLNALYWKLMYNGQYVNGWAQMNLSPA